MKHIPTSVAPLRLLPDLLTLVRLLLSPVLLVLPPLSAKFLGVYLLCGVSDMLDGPLARRLGAESAAGAVLDSAADAVFLFICLLRLLPVLDLPAWAWAAAGAVLAIRLLSLGLGARHHQCGLRHTAANRLCGLMLFLSPFVLHLRIGLVYLALLCAVAAFSALQELALNWAERR